MNSVTFKNQNKDVNAKSYTKFFLCILSIDYSENVQLQTEFQESRIDVTDHMFKEVVLVVMIRNSTNIDR